MRVIASTFRDSIEASNSSEVVLIFVKITHPNLDTPIYVNSDIRDYVLNGNTYIGTAIDISLLSDDDNQPQAKITIPNVDRSIGETVLALTTSPRLEMTVYAASDWDTASPANPIVAFLETDDGSLVLTDDGNPIMLDTFPVKQYSAPDLFLRNVQCDAVGLSADIMSYDITTEPWPSIRSTRDRLPGLYR